MTKRRIAIMAAGAVGGYFGARLAKAGNDVIFFARGRHLDAMREKGLRVQSQLGDLHIDPVQVASGTSRFDPVDAIIFAVKLADTEKAAEACKPLLNPGTPVFTFQNGVESAARVGAILGDSHVVPGAAYVASLIEKPGVIRHTGTMARLVFGEPGGAVSARSELFYDACLAAGINVEMVSDPQFEIWSKFVRLAPLAGVTALTRMPIGPVRENSETRTLLSAAVAEAVAVGRAQGVNFAVGTEEDVVDWVRNLPAEMTSSMAHDLAAGRPLELPWLSGAVVRLGAKSGVPTPTHRFIVQALALQQPGGR